MRRWLENLEQFAIEVILHRKPGIGPTLFRVFLHGLSWIYAGLVRLRLKLYRERLIHDHHLGVPGHQHRQPHGGRHRQDAGHRTAGARAAKARAQGGHPQPRLQEQAGAQTARWKKWLMKLRGIAPPPRPPRVVSDGRRSCSIRMWRGRAVHAGAQPAGRAGGGGQGPREGRPHAIKHFKADTLLLDDGLQYLRLRHRLDMVLVDRTAPWGNGFLLPRGTLREPPRHLKRASYIFPHQVRRRRQLGVHRRAAPAQPRGRDHRMPPPPDASGEHPHAGEDPAGDALRGAHRRHQRHRGAGELRGRLAQARRPGWIWCGVSPIIIVIAKLNCRASSIAVCAAMFDMIVTTRKMPSVFRGSRPRKFPFIFFGSNPDSKRT